jgi:hypothetical protein
VWPWGHVFQVRPKLSMMTLNFCIRADSSRPLQRKTGAEAPVDFFKNRLALFGLAALQSSSNQT